MDASGQARRPRPPRHPARIAVSLVALVALATLAAPAAHAGPPPRAVIVVRHAEKTAERPDPALSEAGRARAAALARALADVPLDAIYSTPFRRTLETAEALRGGDDAPPLVRTEYGGDAEAFARSLAERILRERAGGTALVVGHSNTVPATLRALGVRDAPELTEQDYDDLFVVTWDADGRARLLHVHYGAGSP